MKKASEVFKSIRFAKGETRDKPHKSTDEEGHYTVGEKEFNQQLKHVKKMAMMEETPPIKVRSLYTQTYAKHGGTISKAKDASAKAYDAVEKKHGKEMRDSLEAFHKKNMNEAVKDKFDIGEYDQEGDMAKSDLRSILANAKRVHDMLEDDDNLPEWVQSKITKAEDYISTVANYMEAEMNEEVVNEVSDTTLTSYREKAKKSADKLESEKKYGKALNRRIGILQATSKMVGRAGEKIGQLAKENVEQLDELSPATKSSYVQKAKKEVEELKPHTTGEYGDIAKNIIKRREKGIAMAKEETDLQESGGDVVYKKGDYHIEKYGEDAFALYANGKKQKYYTSINAAKEAIKEDVEQLDEKNAPTNPDLWSRAKALARSKFDVYPSAYANGWAAKWYKSKGGGWKSVSEEVEQIDEILRQDTAKSFVGYDAKKEKDDLPFTPDKPKKPSVIPGKHGAGYSTARHLARMAMQKQSEKMKKPIKEEEMSKKAQIVKDVMKKKKESADAFQKDPIISKTEVKM